MWQALTARIQSLAADPLAYIDVAITAKDPSQNWRPNQLCDDASLEAWHIWCNSQAKSLADSLACQMQRLAGAATSCRCQGAVPPDHVLGALLAPLSGLEPLFCYSAAAALAREHPAHAMRLRQIARRCWLAGAEAQYAVCPSYYDQAWGEFIPRGLRKAQSARKSGLWPL